MNFLFSTKKMVCSRLTDYSLGIRIKTVKQSIRIISLLLLYSISSTTHAQVIDSIKLALKAEPRVFFGFQNRNTFVNTQTIKLWGIVGGLDYDKKVKLYVGYDAKQDNSLNYSMYILTDIIIKSDDTIEFSPPNNKYNLFFLLIRQSYFQLWI